MNPYTPGWLALIGAGVAYELHAVAHRPTTPGGSLSSHVWRFNQHPVRRAVFVVGWTLLSAHLLFHFL